MALSMFRFTRISLVSQFTHRGEFGPPLCLPLLKNVQKINENQQAGYPSGKHYNPLFRRQRREKVWKEPITTPPTKEEIENMSTNELRKLKAKLGMKMSNPYSKDLCMKCTVDFLERYNPPEGQGKSFLISTQRAKDKLGDAKSKSQSMMGVRKINKYEEFDRKSFATLAQEIYVEAYSLLPHVRENKKRFLELVTEHAYPEMTEGLQYKTIKWDFISTIQSPKVVMVRVSEPAQFGEFAQVTVRFHTKQKLAVYDRFGRLMFGSEELSKDVLEYIVFEKAISNLYGMWRIHGRIPLEVDNQDFPLVNTIRKPAVETEEEKVEETELEEATT